MELVMGNIWKHMKNQEKCWENEMILELAMEVCGIYGKNIDKSSIMGPSSNYGGC